jgi:23S rRNA maturation-related 3'-5' exoribonuclease YhaM
LDDAARGSNTVTLAVDGRSKDIRKKLELADEHDSQKLLEGAIVFWAPQTGDIRFKNRKTFGGDSNVERLEGTLPSSVSSHG